MVGAGSQRREIELQRVGKMQRHVGESGRATRAAPARAAGRSRPRADARPPQRVARTERPGRRRSRARRRRHQAPPAARSHRGCCGRRGSSDRARVARPTRSARHHPNTSAALRLDRGARAPRTRRRALDRQRLRRCAPHSPAGWACPRTACGDRYGASVSTSSRSAGTRTRRRAQLVGLRVRDVAGKRDPPVLVRQALLEPLGHREAVEDHPHAAGRARTASPACRPRPRACGSPAACRSRAPARSGRWNARSWSSRGA